MCPRWVSASVLHRANRYEAPIRFVTRLDTKRPSEHYRGSEKGDKVDIKETTENGRGIGCCRLGPLTWHSFSSIIHNTS